MPFTFHRTFVSAQPRVLLGRAGGARGNVPGLTGLRGIAAWWVVLFHFKEFLPPVFPGWIMETVRNGFLAVDLFFVLSGLIIAHNYLHMFSRFKLREYGYFLGVRLARIYPLHIVMLLIFLINPIAIAVAGSDTINPIRYSPTYYMLSIFLLQNWGFTVSLAWNVPAWSISTEWFVYLGFPLVAWVANRGARSVTVSLAGIVVPLLILALALDTVGTTLGGAIVENGLLRCFTEFIAGVFVHRLWLQSDQHPIHDLLAATVLAGAAVCYFYLDFADQWTIPVSWVCAVFLMANCQRAATAIFSNRVLETIGTWSYSTYLCHYFVRDWVKFLLVRDGISAWLQLACYLMVTLIASALLYRLIEVPGRRHFRAILERAISRN